MDKPLQSVVGPGPRLWLTLFRAFRHVEKADLESVRALGFRCITDFAVLEILYHQGPLPVRSIGERILLTSGSVTTAIDRAEKEGLVTREPDTRDKRSVLVSLTPEGHDRIQCAFSKHAQSLNACFECLTETEQRDLTRLLIKVARSHKSSGESDNR